MGKKRRMILIASLVMGLSAGSIAATTLAACGRKPQPEVVIEDVTGVYYGEAGGKDCEVSLDGTSSEFNLVIGGEIKRGTYTYDGTNLNLTFSDSSIIVASLTKSSDEKFVISLNYNGTAFTLAETQKHSVSFVFGNKVLDSATVVDGKKVAEPASPSQNGYVFMGWYEDANFNTAFNFSNKAITGDTTVYAKFIAIDSTKNVYEVTFDAGEGVTAPAAMQTVNGVIYNLPTVSKSGATFAGWWVSDYNDATKLTYKYEGQEIKENITLFAVWDTGAPLVSVNSTGIKWTAKGVSNNYKVEITLPDGTSESPVTVGAATYGYNFTQAGDYEITITLGNESTTVYYKSKALARVSLFSVEGNVLKWVGVENAEKYLISIDCGNEEHNHTDLDLGDATEYDFSACEMQVGGIKFTVKAVAEGFVTSVGEPKPFDRTLSAVTQLAVDAATEVVTWQNVDNAEYYRVVVKNGDTELFNGLANSGEVSLKNYGASDLTVEVTPVTFGYNSPEKTTTIYNKKRLATPTGVKVNGYVVSWDGVEDAQGYTVKINGTTYDAAATSYDFTSVATGSTKLTLSVAAKGANASLYSDEITFETAINTAMYNSGKVSWNAVLGAVKYGVQVGDADEVIVDDGSLSAALNFTSAGETSIKVSAYNQAGDRIGAQREVKVTLYAVTFESNGGTEVGTVYLATGDDFVLPTVNYAGYTLDGWYDKQGGAADVGKRVTDGVFKGTADATYYAFWIGKEFKLTFSVDQDITIEATTAAVQFGKEFMNLPTPKHYDTRIAFAGWFTEANGKGTKLTDEYGNGIAAWNRYEDTTVYPYWVEIYKFNLLTDGTYSVQKGTQITVGGIKEITIPSSYLGKVVSVVEGAAFQSCSNLIRVNLPNTIKLVQMGSAGGNAAGSAFQGCTKLEEVNVYEVDGYSGEVFYESHEGALICHRETTGETELLYYPYAKQGEYVIPDIVTTIPLNVFKNCALTKITIPASVNYIGDTAFYYNNYLTEVVFLSPKAGESVKPLTFGERVFSGCSKLTKVTLPSHMAKLSHQVTEDSKTFTRENDFYDLFYSCYRLTEIYVDSANEEYSSSADGLVLSKDGRTLVHCPKGREGDYTIPVGITKIGDRAFYYCSYLTSITIPEWVTEIGADAFYDCYGLKSVNFLGTSRDGDLTINERAFYYCTNSAFKSIVLPENLTVLKKNAFGYCTNLTTVTINCDREEFNYEADAFSRLQKDIYTYSSPATVTTVILGAKVNKLDIKGVFGGTYNILETVTVDPANDNFTSRNGVLFNKDITEIVFYPSGRTNATYVLPDTVKRIGASVFANAKSLTKMQFGSTVEEIANGAFSGCSGLEEIEFVGNRTTALVLGEKAFENCLKLTSVTLPEMTTVIGSGAFKGCVELRSINIPTTVTEFGTDNDVASVFAECTKFSAINVTAGNEKFASADGVLCGVEGGKTVSVLYSPIFNSGDANKTVTLPATITSVAASAFSGNINIEKIAFASNTADTKITIGAKAFYKCQSLKEVQLPVGLETIETLMLYECPALEKVTIPYTVKTIKSAAFARCFALKDVIFEQTPSDKEEVALTLEKGSSYYSNSYGPSASYESRLGVFANCTALVSIDLPSRLTAISDYTFCYAGLKSLTLTEGLTSINKYAFYYSELSEVYIPSTVTLVDANAFGNCSNLQTAVFATSKSSVTLGDSVFYYCDLRAEAEENGKVTGLVLPTKLISLGNSVFSSNKNLEAVELADTLTTIGNSCFAYCESLKSIVIPDSVISVGTSAFSGCSALESAKLSTSKDFKVINSSTFYNCKQLKEVVIPDNITEIGSSAFSNCETLPSVSIPANIQTIGSSAFYNCYALADVTFKTKIKDKDESGEEITYDSPRNDLYSLGEYAFRNCTSLETFTFPESTVTSGFTIGNMLLMGCTNLTTVNLSSSVTDIKQMFEGCGSIQTLTIAAGNKNLSMDSEYIKGQPLIFSMDGTKIKLAYGAVAAPGVYTIPEGITEIDAYALKGQNNITGLILPSSLTSIGNYAFQNCRSLKFVKFHENSKVSKIGNYAFSSCLSLSSMTIGDGEENTVPASVTELGSYAFSNCAFESFTVPTTVKTIGTYAFEYNYELKSVYHLSESFGNYIYQYCQQLKTVYLNSAATTLKGKYVFSYCSVLDTVKSYDVSSKKVTGEDGVVTFPSRLTSVGELGSYTYNYLFQYSAIKKVKIPASLTTFGADVFTNCQQLEEVEFDKDGQYALGDYLFDKCAKLTTIKNSEGITSIGNFTFRGCSITSIILPECTSIGRHAFDCCQITSISLPECTSIDEYAFAGCNKLESISLPKCENIGNYAFGYSYDTQSACGALHTVELGTDSSLNIKIGNYAFGDYTSYGSAAPVGEDEDYYIKRYSCYNLENINLERVVSIGGCAFFNCIKLKNVDLSACETIGNSAFGNCRELETVKLSTTNDVTLGKAVFGGVAYSAATTYSEGSAVGSKATGDKKLREINLEKVVSIGERCFDGCETLGLKVDGYEDRFMIDLSACEKIGYGAFANCTLITDLTLNAGVDFVSGDLGAFQNCTALQTVTGDLSGNIGDRVFWGCTALDTIDLSKVTSLGYGTFYGCESLVTVDLSAMTSIGGWAFANCTKFDSLKLGQTCSTVGEAAFKNCTALTGIIDFSMVTSLGGQTFYDCSGIKGVVLNSTITEIPDYMFCGCTNITFIDIPVSVTSIGEGAFYGSGLAGELNLRNIIDVGDEAFGSTDIEKVVITGSLNSINNNAFGECAKLTEFEVGAENTKFVAGEDGALYAKTENSEARTLICYPSGKTGDVVIAANTAIAAYAFAGCDGITSITLPADTTKINSHAFEGFNGEINFAIPNTVTEIDSYAYQGTNIAAITLPAELKKIGEGAFRESTLASIVIPEGVETISDYAFAFCTELTTIEIPSSVTSIGAHAFDGCTKLSNVTLHKGLETIGESAFLGCKELTTVIIPDEVQSVGDYAFESCKGLKSVTFGKNVGALGMSAFYNCTNLETVTFGDGFGTIGLSAFGKKYATTVSSSGWTSTGIVDGEDSVCEKLATVTFEGSVNTIEKYAFRNTGLTDVILPTKIEKIDDYAFADCEKLRNVTISADVGKYDAVKEEFVYDFGYYVFINSISLEKVVIKEGVTSFGNYCFQGSTGNNLQVTLPGTLTAIPSGAFQNCTSLASITIPESVEKIGYNALEKTGLTQAVVPACSDLGSNLFYGCEKLESVTFADGVTAIPSYTFRGCIALKSITLPSTIKSIGYYAFKDSGLTSVTLNEGLESIDWSAFEGTNITEINLPSSLTSIGSSAFAKTKITKVKLGANVSVSSSAFEDCTELTEVEIEEGFKTLNTSLFKNCTSISKIIIPVSVTTVNSAFTGWLSNQTIILCVKEGLELGNYWTSQMKDCSAKLEVRLVTDAEETN